MDGTLATELWRRLIETRQVNLTDEETDGLEAEAQDSLLARKILGMHYFKTGAFEKAVAHARVVFDLEPGPEAARNVVGAMERAGALDDAMAFTTYNEAYFDPIDKADRMCGILCRMGRHEEAAQAGREALALKDAQSEEVERPEPIVRPFNPRTPERNVIAFSLFGSDHRYIRGAHHNAIVARYLYPGWTVRFYVDESVSTDVCQVLIREGAQLRRAKKLPAATYGLFWRFLVEDDPDVDLYLVRDADSVMNIRERAAVEDWLASGQPYHAMRDYPGHSELMLAGMWGAHRGNLEPMGKRILTFVREAGIRLNDRVSDQRFLREVIWPLVRRDILIHDDWFGFGAAVPFREEFTLPWPMHVGQNDWVRFRPSTPGETPAPGEADAPR